MVTGWCKLRFETGWRYIPTFFSAMIFISVLFSLMDFSDIVILCNRPVIIVANKTLSILICLYNPQVCFHERVPMTVKQI